MFIQSATNTYLESSRKLKPLRQFSLFCLIITATVISNFFISNAYAAESAGRVIMARGDVTAIDENGTTRNLKRRDPIFNHEIIKTGDNSKVQIRFVDNALLALKANSELNIKSYVFSENNIQDDKVIMELVAGGFRTLTGKIGKGNKEAYQVNTPAASIGIRGTLYEIQISLNGLLAAVWKGGISLDTPQGEFNLGIGADFDFGEISSSGRFTGLLTPPNSFTSPDSSNTRATDPTNANPNNNEEENPNSADSNIPSPFEKDKKGFSSNHVLKTILKQDKNGQLVITKEFNQLIEKNPDLLLELISTLDIDEEDITFDTNTPDETIPPSFINLHLNDLEIDQFNSTSDLKSAFISDGTPRVSVALNTNGDENGELFFITHTTDSANIENYEVIRRGSAIEFDLTGTPSSELVDWGVWQGTEQTPIQNYNLADSDIEFTPITKNMFYAIAEPASQASLADVSGRFSTYMDEQTQYSNPSSMESHYLALASNGESVTSVSTSFDVKSTTETMTVSNVELIVQVAGAQETSQYWNLYSGEEAIDVANSGFAFDNLTGWLNETDEATGSFSGVFLEPAATGESTDTFTGGFNLSTVNGNNSVDGIVILKAEQESLGF